MSISILNAGAAGAAQEQFGFWNALNNGGVISYATAGILLVMLFFTLYIFFTKVFEQQKIINQGRRVRATFWNSNSLREGAAKLEKNSAYKQLVDDGLAAQEQHAKLTDPVEAHDWLHGSLQRSEDTINSPQPAGARRRGKRVVPYRIGTAAAPFQETAPAQTGGSATNSAASSSTARSTCC
jgi:biopolymer transport protein ExbB